MIAALLFFGLFSELAHKQYICKLECEYVWKCELKCEYNNAYICIYCYHSNEFDFVFAFSNK